MVSKIIRFILPLIPVTSLTLAAQVLYAWIYPLESISQDFFSTASHLFLFELIFMHSSVFWEGRYYFFSGKIKKSNPIVPSRIKDFFFGLFLFIVYGLFVFPWIDDNPYLVLNYITLSLLRFLQAEGPPWYIDTDFYKIGLDKQARPMLMAMTTLFKLFYFAMVLPILVSVLPIPDFGLNPEIIKNFPTDPNDPFGLIIITKSLFFYFCSLALFDLLLWIYKFKKKKPAQVAN